MAKRFYKTVSVAQEADGYVVKLDTHVLKTPAKNPLLLPTADLAELVASDWQAQGDDIDAHSMFFMRLVSTAIDRVADTTEETARAFAAFGMSDLLCYRAEAPDKLTRRQAAAWDPLLDWAQQRFDMSFEVTTSVLPVAQPTANEACFMAAAQGGGVYRLTGLAHGAALLGSGVLALALNEGYISPKETFELAFLDDLFQIEEWGYDEEAQGRLDNIALEVEATARYLFALGE